MTHISKIGLKLSTHIVKKNVFITIYLSLLKNELLKKKKLYKENYHFKLNNGLKAMKLQRQDDHLCSIVCFTCSSCQKQNVNVAATVFSTDPTIN